MSQPPEAASPPAAKRGDMSELRKNEGRASTTEIFQSLVTGAQGGRHSVLVTIAGLTDTGARAVGTHMLVFDDGESVGSLSSGCVEAAIVSQALELLGNPRPLVVRYGQGSPYIDIRLPCGGGMDVLFLPHPAPGLFQSILDRLHRRQPATVALGLTGGSRLLDQPAASGVARDSLVITHVPPMRIVCLGNGAEMLAFMDIAAAFGAIIEVLSPSLEIVAAAVARGHRGARLLSPSSLVPVEGDPWTAFLFLFHDHDWEPPLLARVLPLESFWVGAMGSPRTQKDRLAALSEMGVAEHLRQRVRGPIGLIPSSRAPATLALSALAEIVDAASRNRGEEAIDLRQETRGWPALA